VSCPTGQTRRTFSEHGAVPCISQSPVTQDMGTGSKDATVKLVPEMRGIAKTRRNRGDSTLSFGPNHRHHANCCSNPFAACKSLVPNPLHLSRRVRLASSSITTRTIRCANRLTPPRSSLVKRRHRNVRAGPLCSLRVTITLRRSASSKIICH